MYSEYDRWNEVKKKISESCHKPPYYNELDVWWVSIGLNIGYEVYGKGKDFGRPVLILKKFNRFTFLGIPLSTKLKENRYYIPITLNGRKVSALISQVRVFSSDRILCKIAELDLRDYEKVLEKVLDILKLSPSITRGSRG